MEAMEGILSNLLSAENVQKVNLDEIGFGNFSSKKCDFPHMTKI
jgi:hypothetical protein